MPSDDKSMMKAMILIRVGHAHWRIYEYLRKYIVFAHLAQLYGQLNTNALMVMP